MRRSIGALAVAALFSGACAGRAAPPPSAPPPSVSTAEEVAPPAPLPSSDGAIARAELLPILDAGFGRFLQGVEVEPVRDAGRFVGFRILSLWPDDPRFQKAGIVPGDVVLRVNGQPIERPEQALSAWNGLRVASELVVEFLRDGQRQEARFGIVD